MAISNRDQRELAQAFTDYSPTYGGLKEDYFAALYLTRKFKQQLNDIAHQIAFGGNDFGLDAYYIDRDARNLYLYQFKWSENYTLFKDTFKRLIDRGMGYVFGNKHQEPIKNDLLEYLKHDLNEHRALIDRVYIEFVYKGDREALDKSLVLAYLVEELENKKFLIDQFFGRPVELSVELVAGPVSKPPSPAHTQFDLALNQTLSATTLNGENMYVGFIPLMDLHRIHIELKQRFFDHNIRAGLSPELPPNKKIREALARIVLKEQEASQVFAFNHNGVTIAAEELQFAGDKAVIVAPRLLNGAQTVTSLAKFLDDNEDNDALKRNRERLESIRVLAKVIVPSTHKDFIVGVTIANNRQNPVEPWNLRASDLIQLELEEKFRDELGIFYERQEGAFEGLSDDMLTEMGIEQYKAIEIKRLAQTFLAIQGEVDKVSRLPDVFESDNDYKNTFRESYLKGDARRILLAYKIQFPLNRILRDFVEQYPKTYAYLAYARNLVWALFVQGLFNEGKLGKTLEDYGTRLTVEAGFKDLLRGLLSKRLRPILAQVTSDKQIQERIKNEKYSFLRTKSTFQDCMEVAYEKFDWTKRSI